MYILHWVEGGEYLCLYCCIFYRKPVITNKDLKKCGLYRSFYNTNFWYWASFVTHQNLSLDLAFYRSFSAALAIALFVGLRCRYILLISLSRLTWGSFVLDIKLYLFWMEYLSRLFTFLLYLLFFTTERSTQQVILSYQWYNTIYIHTYILVRYDQVLGCAIFVSAQLGFSNKL